jgi:Domain of unknown function (DUF4387)
MTRVGDYASFVRSKNAGPFVCTVDIFFDDPEKFRHVADSGAISARAVAVLYGIPERDVQFYRVDAAMALKVSFPRLVQAGDPADTDICAGQQFVPILDIEVGAK